MNLVAILFEKVLFYRRIGWMVFWGGLSDVYKTKQAGDDAQLIRREELDDAYKELELPKNIRTQPFLYFTGQINANSLNLYRWYINVNIHASYQILFQSYVDSFDNTMNSRIHKFCCFYLLQDGYDACM